MSSSLQESATKSKQLLKNQKDMDSVNNSLSPNYKQAFFPYNAEYINTQYIAMPDVLPSGGKLVANAKTEDDCKINAAQTFASINKINMKNKGFVEGAFTTSVTDDGQTSVSGTLLPLDGNKSTTLRVTGPRKYSLWINEAMLTPFASNVHKSPFIVWKHVPVNFLLRYTDFSGTPIIDLVRSSGSIIDTKAGPPIQLTKSPVYYNFNTDGCTVFEGDISSINETGGTKDVVLWSKPVNSNTTVGLNEMGQLMMYDTNGTSTHLFGEPANASKNSHQLTLNSIAGTLSLNNTVIARGLDTAGAITSEWPNAAYRNTISSKQVTANGMRIPEQKITDKQGLVSNDNKLLCIIENDALIIKKRIKTEYTLFSVQPDYKMGKTFLTDANPGTKTLVPMDKANAANNAISNGYEIGGSTDYQLLNTTYRPGFNMNHLMPEYQALDTKTRTEYGLKTPDLVGDILMPITYEGFATQQEEVIKNIDTSVAPLYSQIYGNIAKINKNVLDISAGLQEYRTAKSKLEENSEFSGNTIYTLNKPRSKTAAILKDRETMLTEQNNLYIVSLISVAALFVGAIAVSTATE